MGGASHYVDVTLNQTIPCKSHLKVIYISQYSVNSIFKGNAQSVQKGTLNLWWISNKTIMEIGDVTKAATFFVTDYFHETNINRWFFGGYTKIKIARFL